MLVTLNVVPGGSRPNRVMAPTSRVPTSFGAASYASRSIIGFRTVRHLPNGMTYPNPVSLCYRN
jgi:hypothetical protein